MLSADQQNAEVRDRFPAGDDQAPDTPRYILDAALGRRHGTWQYSFSEP